MTRADKLMWVASVFAGAAVWAAFALFDTEPSDALWALGIFFGQAIFGFASLATTGGGANLFLPLGLAFLVPFTLPALAGTFAGAALTRWR